MNPNDQQDPSQTFYSEQPQAQYSKTQAPPPAPKPPRKGNKILILVAVIFLLAVIISGVTIAILSVKNTEKRCLTSSDITALIGNTSSGDDTTSQDPTYTYAIEFNEYDTTISKNSKQVTEDFTNRLAKFYKEHSARASISIVLTQDYIGLDSPELYTERLAYIQSVLVEKGIDKSAIQISDPENIPDSGEGVYSLPLYITVASNEACVPQS